ncbi:MAG TPA: iron-sulfur cluster repair di-iron protein [Terriglobales bacterium]|nr:iron-sulfur cluster repair di-iron protein [Terriglobales bacterium]
MNLEPTATVREFATSIPNATRLFEQLGIDYCCGGNRSLNDACARAGLPLATVLHRLEEGESDQKQRSSAAPEVTAAGLTALIDHIVTRHHGYVKQEIPRLQQLLKKVVAVHGNGHPELLVIQQNFRTLSAEMTKHMMKEENVVFPYIVYMEEAVQHGKALRQPAFGTIAKPIQMMELEHESSGDALKRMREASAGYAPPENACFSYRTLYAALIEFEADMHQHIHLENNILFPRAVEMEQHSRQTVEISGARV